AFRCVHVDTVAEAAHAVRASTARALLLSPARLENEPNGNIERLIARCPGVTPIAVVSDDVPSQTAALMQLGALGVRQVVDLREPTDYERLRTLVTSSDSVVSGRILDAVFSWIGGTTDGMNRFLVALIQKAPDVVTVRELSAILS